MMSLHWWQTSISLSYWYGEVKESPGLKSFARKIRKLPLTSPHKHTIVRESGKKSTLRALRTNIQQFGNQSDV